MARTPSYEHTRASYSAYRVGQYTAIAGSEAEAFENVHFCGEHTSIDAQGYMEGGALSGAVAADEVATALGAAPEGQTRTASFGLLLRPSRLTPAERIQLRVRAAREQRRWKLAAIRARRRSAA